MSKRFYFKGQLSSSKSLVNRALIIQSFQPNIELQFQSQCDDVLALQKALTDFKRGETSFQCQDAGTVLRFLMPRLARQPGVYRLCGRERLLSRPHEGLIQALQILGVVVKKDNEAIVLKSSGWNPTECLMVDGRVSSQFLSSILLSAWELPFDLKIQIPRSLVSQDYFIMTKKMCQMFGMEILVEESSGRIIIPSGQKPKTIKYKIEPDMSSCFAIAAIASVAGEVIFKNFPFDSLQPDFVFTKILQAMGNPVERSGSDLRISFQERTQPISWDLNSCPDLFPVLAVLAARAEGVSHFTGLSQLKHKESDRLKNAVELVERCGRQVDLLNDAVKIYGSTERFSVDGNFLPDHDHRMAMAAQLANFYGAQLQIDDRHVVNKSFPEFWSLTEEFL